jgi:glucose/mannose-6-phosphate isomerase
MDMSEQIASNDPSNMRKLILSFPDQAQEAVHIGEKSAPKFPISKIQNIVVSGLGGSAIGGDLLRSYLSGDLKVPMIVNRNYSLPSFVNERSLVIISSYSGNTEETISSFNDAVKRKAKILCVTSGGDIKKIASKKRYPIIEIPGGLPPRAALGYSFFPMLIALYSLGFVKSKAAEIKETIIILRKKAAVYSDLHGNRAMEIAEMLHGKLPLIYSATDRFDVINLRWRGQCEENAKTLAYGNVFPELNHNEIVGWDVLKSLMPHMHVVMLRDIEDQGRIQLRMNITQKIVRDVADGVTEVRSEGKSLLARMFSLLHLGDWVSFYLAMMNGVDPTPVKKIDYLKDELAKVR